MEAETGQPQRRGDVLGHIRAQALAADGLHDRALEAHAHVGVAHASRGRSVDVGPAGPDAVHKGRQLDCLPRARGLQAQQPFVDRERVPQ